MNLENNRKKEKKRKKSGTALVGFSGVVELVSWEMLSEPQEKWAAVLATGFARGLCLVCWKGGGGGKGKGWG